MTLDRGGGGTWTRVSCVPGLKRTSRALRVGSTASNKIAIPWAEPGGQFTLLFERLAIDFLRECSVTGAAALLRITWDEAWGIKERAVQRGLARRTAEPMRYLGVDEKAITKGHRYLTIVADLIRQRVLFLNDDRETESLDTFWPTCTPAQLASIEAVAMDMWEPYGAACKCLRPAGEGPAVVIA